MPDNDNDDLSGTIVVLIAAFDLHALPGRDELTLQDLQKILSVGLAESAATPADDDADLFSGPVIPVRVIH